MIEDSTSGAKAGHAAGCKVSGHNLFPYGRSTCGGRLDRRITGQGKITILPQDQGLELEFTPLKGNS